MKSSTQNGVMRNERRPCRVRGCGRYRRGLSAYCREHRILEQKECRYGWTNGRRIQKKEYAGEKAMIKALIESNLEHPGIIKALEFLDGWVKGAGQGRKVTGIRYLARLYDQGVSAMDVLVETASIFCFAHLNPRTLPPDQKPLRMALGYGIIYLAKQDCQKRTNSEGKTIYVKQYQPLSAVQAIGKHVTEKIGILLMKMQETLGQKSREEEERCVAMAVPFEL